MRTERSRGFNRSDFYFVKYEPVDVSDTSAAVEDLANECSVDETLIWSILDEGRHILAERNGHNGSFLT